VPQVTSTTKPGCAVSVALLGCAVGAWYAGRPADRLGRVRVMQIAVIVFIVSAVVSAFHGKRPRAHGQAARRRLRHRHGVGVAPTCVAEVAPAHLRGRLGSLQQLALMTGILLALLSD